MLKIITQIIEEFTTKIHTITAKLHEYLMNGRLFDFEQDLWKEIQNLYNQLALAFLSALAESMQIYQRLQALGAKKGLGKLRKSKVKLRLKTGEEIWIASWYAEKSASKRKTKKNSKPGPNGSGCHLLLDYWGCIHKATPSYYSLVAMLCILCPSFVIVEQVLANQQIQGEEKQIRDIAYAVGKKALANRVTVGLQPGETLDGKRVLISTDGGRTRTRKDSPQKKNSKQKKYQRMPYTTDWCEPKLLVIHTIATDGTMEKTSLPIYDCTIDGPDECFKVLADYLQQLEIAKASEILFIADGALWIWNRVRETLESLAVPPEKIVEAVDYYHAVEHLATTFALLPQLSPRQKKLWFTKMKTQLWHGDIDSLVAKITELAQGNEKAIAALNYFSRNKHRMHYQLLRQKNLPCGSGVVESAIRRVINLRFKCPSTFWHIDNVEKLIFLRCLFLAGRWNILITNLSQNHCYSNVENKLC